MSDDAQYCQVMIQSVCCLQPVKMIETLSSVMDNETQPFVHKLYYMVICQTEKAALNIMD